MKTQDIGKAIGILNNQIKRYFESSTATKEITGMQGQILHFLLGHGGEICPKDIEEEFGIRRSTVSRYLISMEKSGIVERRGIEDDKRIKQIVLTKKAQDLNNSVQDDIRFLERKISKGLTVEEKNEFLRLSRIIERNMDE